MTNSEQIQLIFIVETTAEAKIDDQYIWATLEEYYSLGENRISFIYLEGKYKYNAPQVLKKLNKEIKDFASFTKGKSYVIHTFDKDRAHAVWQDNNFVKEVTAYCKQNNYYLVWFVKTVEEVFWGERVKQDQKREAAIQFRKRNGIRKVNKTNLLAAANVNSAGKSNILTILNKFKEIKK